MATGKATPATPARHFIGESAGHIRLRTLVLIRWVAIAGQATTILGVHYGLGFPLPILPALGFVGVSVAFNVLAGLRQAPGTRLSPRAATVHLGYDILQLSALLMLTGGLTNPFATMILAPAIVSATVLSRNNTIGLGLITGGCITVLAFVHLPVPLGIQFQPPELYVAGLWAALILAGLFFGIYVGSVSEEARRMFDALAATQMALAREQRLSALGALAAAAAHELGSPLSTIAVTAREMSREVPADGPLADDVALLISQSDRCRDILAALARSPESAEGTPFGRMPFGALVAAAAEPHRGDTVALVIDTGPAEPEKGAVDATNNAALSEPQIEESPEIVHGLGNLVQNAVQHARSRAEVAIRWSAAEVSVTITDDGPGFPSAVRDRLGDPYLSHDTGRTGEEEHMGLGIFIASTLLARTGAQLSFGERSGGGAEVSVIWNRAALEAKT